MGLNLTPKKIISTVTPVFFGFLKGKMIVHLIKQTFKIFNVRIFNILFILKIEILFWGNYQNISCSNLLWLWKANIFQVFAKA